MEHNKGVGRKNLAANFKKLTSFFLCWIISLPVWAEEKVKMAETLRESGKIYVVVGVVVLIFIGMVIYLINLDRKISQIAREQSEEEKQ